MKSLGWHTLLAACFLLSGLLSATAADPMLEKKTYTYKKVGPVEIQADVYRSADQKPQPVIVSIHGGALMMGGRGGAPRNLLDMCRKEGIILVSIDYRLLPQVKVPEIVEDVRDALAWIRKDGPKLFAADPERIAVTGGSAGGYLTLMTGFGSEPRPRALVSYFGFGDLTADWTTKPNAAYQSKFADRSVQEMRERVGQQVVTSPGQDSAKPRSDYFVFLKQKGLWSNEAMGFDVLSHRDRAKPYCPLQNVTERYPPTMLIHGTADTDVASSESEAMAQALAAQKVPHELILLKGAGHGLRDGDRELVAEAHERALAFLRDHLKNK